MNNYLKIIAAMLIWSTWGIMIRWLELPAAIILFYASLIASVSVPAVLLVRDEFSLAGINTSGGTLVLLTIATLANNLSYFYALAHTTVSNAVFTHYTAPVFVAILAPILIAERLRKITLISLPIALCGMVLVVIANGGLQLGNEHTSGILAGTFSGVAYAFIIIFSRKLSLINFHHKAVVALTWATAMATAPAAAFMEYHIGLQTGLLLLAISLFHFTLAPLLYYSALTKVIAQHAAILGYMEPLAAIPLAYVLLSETPSVTALIGGVLVLFSGYLVIHARLQEQD